MKNPFVALDSFIIERVFEPVAWRVEYRTGRNNFWLARASIVFVFTCYALFSGILARDLVMAGVGFVLFAIAFGLARVVERYTGKHTANPTRHNMQLLVARFFLMANTVLVLYASLEMILVLVGEMAASPELFYSLLLGTLWYLVLFVGFAAIPAYLYFLACSRMPPWWSEAYSRKLADKLVMQPA